jgi:hypothetical protein
MQDYAMLCKLCKNVMQKDVLDPYALSLAVRAAFPELGACWAGATATYCDCCLVGRTVVTLAGTRTLVRSVLGLFAGTVFMGDEPRCFNTLPLLCSASAGWRCSASWTAPPARRTARRPPRRSCTCTSAMTRPRPSWASGGSVGLCPASWGRRRPTFLSARPSSGTSERCRCNLQRDCPFRPLPPRCRRCGLFRRL